MKCLASIWRWFICRFRDLHSYNNNPTCDECGPQPLAKTRCPDCGKKAVPVVSTCCGREMWIHLIKEDCS